MPPLSYLAKLAAGDDVVLGWARPWAGVPRDRPGDVDDSHVLQREGAKAWCGGIGSGGQGKGGGGGALTFA